MTGEKDYFSWDRKLLNYLWISVILSVIVPIVNFNYVDKEKFTFFMFMFDRVIKPTVIILFFMFALEYIVRKRCACSQYFLIMVVAFIANILMFIHVEAVYAITPIYTIPIFISVFTRESKKIRFAFFVSILSFFFVDFMMEEVSFDRVELITFTAILFSAYILGVAIIRRYEEINENLKVVISNEKELYYKTIYMEKLAKTDLATGLYNHKSFYEYLDKLLYQYENEEFEFHLALFDLDKFKSVNDTYGHAVGDIVIANSAKFIKENVRANDFAARYGGEEFAVLFYNRSAEEIKSTLENIRQKMEATQYKEMGDKNVTVSIGFVSISECINKVNIFRVADERLYRAKSGGRNRIVSCD